MRPIAIIYLDRHSGFRRLAARVLERHFADEVRLLADGDGWPLAAPPAWPDAVLLGLGAEGLVEPRLLTGLKAAFPGVPVVVLGHLHDEAYRAAALQAGAAAFVAKAALHTELLPVLRKVTSRGDGPPRRGEGA